MSDLVSGYEDGLSALGLERKFHIGHSTAIDWLRRAGVRIRRPSESRERVAGISDEDKEFFLEIVDGILLGDGCLDRTGGRLVIEQSRARVGWLDGIKRSLFAFGVDSTVSTVTRKERVRKDGKILPEYNGAVLRTPDFVEMKEQRKRWYPDGTKKVPMDVRITPRSVAAWVSGDGTGGESGSLILCTDSFERSDVEFLVERLRSVFGVRARVTKTGCPRVAIYRKNDVLAIKEAVASYMPDCCLYKFCYARKAQRKGLFSPEQVRDIRWKYTSGVSLAEIAKVYGVSRSAVNNIGLRKVYRDVD